MKLFPKLRGAIETSGLTHSEFAERLGICRVLLSQRLNGKRDWTLGDMYKALDILGVPYALMSEYFPPLPPAVKARGERKKIHIA